MGRAEALLADHDPAAAAADTGRDKKALAAATGAGGAVAAIPAPKNRAEQRDVDPDLYRERTVVERLWARAEPLRRVATRCEKKAANVLAFVWVAALALMTK